MELKILNLLEGAKHAEGLTVIIDVFRAFSVECYLYQQGVKNIYTVGTIEKAQQLKLEHPEYILVGERDGLLLDGFEYGNSPYFINEAEDIKGSTVVHTTSAGTRGIVNAKNATEIITGSFVNAKAIAKYILGEQPEKVSLVAMGNGGSYEAKEDVLCADYIKSLLLNKDFDLSSLKDKLLNNGGERFHQVDTQDSQPKEDFHLCLDYDKFDFVIRADKVEDDLYKMILINQ